MDKKKIGIGLLAICAVALLTMYGPRTVKYDFITMLANKVRTHAEMDQNIEGVRITPEYVYTIYYQDKRIGVLQTLDRVEPLLKEVYDERYASEFPNSSLSFNEDVIVAKELSFFKYEDIDEEILDYMGDNDYFAIRVPKISLSNGYEFYVKSLDDFTEARDKYVLNFISQQGYLNIQNKTEIPTLSEYGSQEVGINIKETIEITEGYASYDDIKKSVEEIIMYLSYGENTELEYHTVEKYDTVEGIAYKYGLEPQHVVMINSDQISSSQDILTVGQKLNVTYYNSPLTIVVTRQRLYSEIVYPPATKYIADNTMNEGLQRVIQAEKEGSADILMEEVYINGVLQEEKSTKLSSTITVAPVQEIIKRGSKVVPGVGTGKFRWPVDNPTITCRWYCYSGHKALDMINRYKTYGNIYAADRGVIITNSYTSVNGYYVRINHNNGFVTYYGHMRNKSSVFVGQKVDKGQWIGTIGSTGKTTGPHLHFAIEKNGVRVNPCIYLGC